MIAVSDFVQGVMAGALVVVVGWFLWRTRKPVLENFTSSVSDANDTFVSDEMDYGRDDEPWYEPARPDIPPIDFNVTTNDSATAQHVSVMLPPTLVKYEAATAARKALITRTTKAAKKPTTKKPTKSPKKSVKKSVATPRRRRRSAR